MCSFEFGDRLLVKIIPDMYDILLGNVRYEQRLWGRRHRNPPAPDQQA